MEGIIHGGDYFRNFTVFYCSPARRLFICGGILREVTREWQTDQRRDSLRDASHVPKAWEAKEGAVLSQVTFFAIRNKELVRRLFSSYPTYFMSFHFS